MISDHTKSQEQGGSFDGTPVKMVVFKPMGGCQCAGKFLGECIVAWGYMQVKSFHTMITEIEGLDEVLSSNDSLIRAWMS